MMRVVGMLEVVSHVSQAKCYKSHLGMFTINIADRHGKQSHITKDRYIQITTRWNPTIITVVVTNFITL